MQEERMGRGVMAVLLLLVFSISISPAMAQDVNEKIQPLLDKINTIIQAAQIILATVSVLVFMYAGYMHMTAEGQPEKEQKARRAFTGALIGLAIVILAEVIKNVVVSLLS